MKFYGEIITFGNNQYYCPNSGYTDPIRTVVRSASGGKNGTIENSNPPSFSCAEFPLIFWGLDKSCESRFGISEIRHIYIVYEIDRLYVCRGTCF